MLTLTLTLYSRGEEKGGKYSEKENIFFWRRRKTEKEKEENICGKSLQKLSRILRSLGFGFGHGLGLGTFANFWRVPVLVSENLVTEKVSVLVSEN